MPFTSSSCTFSGCFSSSGTPPKEEQLTSPRVATCPCRQICWREWMSWWHSRYRSIHQGILFGYVIVNDRLSYSFHCFHVALIVRTVKQLGSPNRQVIQDLCVFLLCPALAILSESSNGLLICDLFARTHSSYIYSISNISTFEPRLLSVLGILQFLVQIRLIKQQLGVTAQWYLVSD